MFSAPPYFIGDPLPILTAVVEVEHRGHRIHPNAVDMVLVEPEQRIGHQEVAHLVAAIVEHQGAPLLCALLCGGSACS